MHKITTSAEIREAIIQLELKRDSQGKLLKEQFYVTYESFKTVNLLKKVIIEIATSPGLLSGLISTVVDLTHRRSHRTEDREAQSTSIKGIFQSLISTSVSKLIYDNSDTLLLLGQYFIRRLFHKKEKKKKEEK
jgi:hypothetical protein